MSFSKMMPWFFNANLTSPSSFVVPNETGGVVRCSSSIGHQIEIGQHVYISQRTKEQRRKKKMCICIYLQREQSEHLQGWLLHQGLADLWFLSLHCLLQLVQQLEGYPAGANKSSDYHPNVLRWIKSIHPLIPEQLEYSLLQMPECLLSCWASFSSELPKLSFLFRQMEASPRGPLRGHLVMPPIYSKQSLNCFALLVI